MMTFTVNLPAHWASYLINDDPSSFALHDDGDAELARIDKWCADNPGDCVDVSQEVLFMPFGSLDCPGELAGDFARYTFISRSPDID